MARGKYLSLEEARKAGQLDQFAKEHPIEDVHPHSVMMDNSHDVNGFASHESTLLRQQSTGSPR